MALDIKESILAFVFILANLYDIDTLKANFAQCPDCECSNYNPDILYYCKNCQHLHTQASTLQDSAGKIYFPQELKCFTCGCINLKADEENICEVCHHDHFSDSNVVSPLNNSKGSEEFEGEEYLCNFCSCKNYKFDDESSECKNCHHEHFPDTPIIANPSNLDHRFNDPLSLNNSGRFYRAMDRRITTDLKESSDINNK